MPHLRFTKDRRGYENTFLVHRRRSHDRSQFILYWFRTPPDIRVGRAALDAEAIRALEEAYPEIQFDWDRIRDVTPPPPSRGGRPGRDGAGAAGAPQFAHRRPRRERRPSAERESRMRGPISGSAYASMPLSSGEDDGDRTTVPAEVSGMNEAGGHPAQDE